MGKYNQEAEDRIALGQKALIARGLEGKSGAIAKVAAEFGCDYDTLRRRVKGSGSVKNIDGRNRALTDEQEKSLVTFLDGQIENSAPVTKEMVQAAAERTIRVSGSNHELGKSWHRKWLQKHPKYQLKSQRNIEPDAPDIYEYLETLIKSQSTEEKSVVDILTDLGTPIVSMAVMDAGDIIAKAFGPSRSFSTFGTAKPFDKDTVFQACSISKPITALAVIKLCQEKRLNLDLPISQYLNQEQLSWISTPQTLPLVCQISLRHLLSHTSGLCCHGFQGYATARVPTLPEILRGDPPANNEPVSLFTLPGQKHSYSGGGFTVIQLVLETQLQQPFHQIMDEVVLRPFKMTRSSYQILPAIEKNYAPAYVNGKLRSDPDHFLLPESAAAGLWTTPSDLLKAIQAVQWSLESDDFLERRWAELMLKEVDDNGMALGWATKKGGVYFGHTGDNAPGYMCAVVGYADLMYKQTDEWQEDESMEETRNNVPKDCGICVMTSSALGSIVFDKLIAAVAYLKGWPSARANSAVPFMDRSSAIDAQAALWCGSWGPGNWSLVDGYNLFIQYGSLPAVPLVPAAIPPQKYDEGNSIDLVADGLELMLRLCWKDGERSIDLWQGGQKTTLEPRP